MAKIPYKFLPIPEEFLTDDFIDDPDMMRLIRWIFKRISTEKKEIVLKRQKRILTLEPFEFMFGRSACSKETKVSEKKIQGRLNTLRLCKFLENVVSKSGSTFSVYTLVTESFSKFNGQHNGQHSGQHVGQHVGHNQEEENIRSKKEDHHPYPSSSNSGSVDDSGLMTDDFFSKSESEEKEEEEAFLDKIEIYDGVFLSQYELDACIKIKGSIEKVREAVDFIMKSPKRKFDIENWPNTLSTWKVENKSKLCVKENLEYAEKLCEEFSDAKKARGWSCRICHDRLKDQKMLVFENESPHIHPVFISITDGKFEEKCSKVLKENNMRKKG